MKLLATTAIVWMYLVGCGFGRSGSAAGDSQHQSAVTAVAPNGVFLGIEEIKNYEPGVKWFHENTVLILNNELLLDKVPLKIAKGRKDYSAFDGGPISYRGRFFRRDKRLFISLRLSQVGCEPYSDATVVSVKITSSGIEIDHVFYRPTTITEEKRLELTIRLRMEPMDSRPEWCVEKQWNEFQIAWRNH